MADTRRDDDRCEHGFAPEACLVCEVERLRQALTHIANDDCGTWDKAMRYARNVLDGGRSEPESECTHCTGYGLCWDGADPLGDCPDEPHRCHACGGSGDRKDQVIF